MCVRPGPGWARTRAASMNRVIYSGVMVGVGRQLLGPKLSSRESRGGAFCLNGKTINPPMLYSNEIDFEPAQKLCGVDHQPRVDHLP